MPTGTASLSTGELERLVYQALDEAFPPNKDSEGRVTDWTVLLDVYAVEKYCVARIPMGGEYKLCRLDFEVAENESSVSFVGEPQQVKRAYVYKDTLKVVAAKMIDGSDAAAMLQSLKENDPLYASLAAGANSHLVVFDLTTVGIPSQHQGKTKYQLSKGGVDSSMPSLIGKPIHVTANYDGHFEAGKAPKAIGVFLGSTKVANADGSITLRAIGTLWSGDFADEVDTIKASKALLGASYEIQYPATAVKRLNASLVEIEEWVFTGGAILKRTDAAHPETQLLVAERVGHSEAQTTPKEEIAMADKMSTKYPGFSAEQEAALEAIVATAVSKVEGETAQAGLKAQLADAGKTIERQERTIAEMKEAMDKDKKKNQDEMASAVEAKVTAEAKAADLEKQIADQKTELETVQASLKEKAEALDKIGFDQKVDQAWASLKEKHGFDEKLRADKEPLLRKQLSGEGLSLEDMEKLFAGAKPKGSTVAPPAPAAPTAANRTPLSTVAASTDLTTEPDLKLVAQNFPAATRLSGVR